MRHLRRVLILIFASALLIAPVLADPPAGKKGRGSKRRVTKYRVATWGAIRGTCRLSHALRPRTVTYQCVEAPPKTGPSQHALHNPRTLTLDGCLVYLDSVKEGKDWPRGMRSTDRTLAMTLHRNDFSPRVAWVREKTQLTFRASDVNEDYQVHGYYRSMTPVTTANFFVSGKVGTATVPGDAILKKGGQYLLRDDCRHYMVAHVHAFSHPYVSGPTVIDGRYELTDVPPGTYTLVCWHEALDFHEVVRGGKVNDVAFGPPVLMRREIVVEPGKTLTLDWTIDVVESLRAEGDAK